jgi:glycosyltransferase involved in cell wall biosynthesis
VSTPQISVLLPTRNGAETLGAAIRSVLESEGIDLELICVDDGSTDETPSILRSWRERDNRVRVLRTPASGIVPALNLALHEARAARVARMDADDEVLADRFRAQFGLLDERPELALAGCRVESFRDGGLAEGYRIYTEWVNGLCSPEEIAREAFVECPIPHPTWMFDRDAVLAAGGYRDSGWPEDLDLLYRLLEKGHALGKVPRVLHRWRDHPERLSRSDPRYRREAFLRVKAHFVGRVHPMRAAVLWGAGRTGRLLARLLTAEGIPIRAFLDIRPERAGSTWRGIPILAPEALPTRSGTWRREGVRILSAVASRGARQEIRSALKAANLEEGSDFLMLA